MISAGSGGGSLVMSLQTFLITDIVIHVVQMVGIVSATVFLVLSKKTRLIHNPNLLLTHILVIGDLLHAIFILPYTVYLTIFWSPIAVNYDPLFIIISSSPLLIQLKANIIIVIAIAFDRLLALFTPAVYRQKNHYVYAFIVTILAYSFGLFDVGLNLSITKIEPHPDCGAIGCFISSSFRYYWGTSNAIMGLIVIMLTLVMIYKLKTLSGNYPDGEKTREGRKFTKANRSAACTLVSSLIFITIPSVLAGVFEFSGYSVFRSIGPFYIVGLLLAGCCHCVTQMKLNNELLHAFKTRVVGVASVGESSRFS